MAIISALFLLCFSQLSLSEELIGYDCRSNNASITAISLTDTAECVETAGSVQSKDLDGQVIQLRLYEPIHVHVCLISVVLRVDQCGQLNHMFSSSRPISSYVKSVGYSACKEVHRSGTLMLFGKELTNLMANKTTSITLFLSGSADDHGYCRNGGVYIMDDGTKMENKLVSASVSVTLFDREETMVLDGNKVILESLGLDCPYDRGYCSDSLAGEIFWTSSDADCFRKVEVLYEGTMEIATYQEVTGKETQLAIIESGSKIFALRVEGYSSLCSHSVMVTEHGRIKIVPKSTLGGYVFMKGPKFHKNVDLTYYVDSKFLYVTSALVKRSDEIYRQFMASMCEMRKSVLENRLVLAQVRSHQVGSLIERKRGVIATIQGEVLYIAQCSPVPVSFRKEMRCYHELPVWYNEEPKFLEPITRIIKEAGTDTVCPLQMLPSFQLHGEWYTYHGKLHRSESPQRLDPNLKDQAWNFKSLLEISRGGLYDKEDMEELQKAMVFGSTRDTLTHNFAKVIYNNGKSGSGGLSDVMTSSAMDEIGHKVGGTFWSITTYLGGWSSMLFTVFILMKAVAFSLDVCLNGTALFSRVGWSVWLLAAPLNAVVHLVLHGIVGRGRDREPEPDDNNRRQEVREYKDVSLEDDHRGGTSSDDNGDMLGGNWNPCIKVHRIPSAPEGSGERSSPYIVPQELVEACQLQNEQELERIAISNHVREQKKIAR